MDKTLARRRPWEPAEKKKGYIRNKPPAWWYEDFDSEALF